MQFKPLLIISILPVIIILTSCNGDLFDNNDYVANVAVLTGKGIWEPSTIAIFAAVDEFKLTSDSIEIEDVLDGSIDKYGMLIIPGCDARDIASTLGPVGASRIRDYVGSGGGFLGIGGGAAVADSDSGLWAGIGLFLGDADYPVEDIGNGDVITGIELVRLIHPLANESENYYQTLYSEGPQFLLYGAQSVDIIYNYERTATPAMISFMSGLGRVVLIGFHPEIEENSDRDSTDYVSDLVDPDSEWDILERAIQYCLWRL